MDNSELLILKRRKAALLREELEERRRNALRYYVPHEKQELFHAAGDFNMRLAEAGNRSGKSEMGAAEDAAWMLGERPWYPVGDERRTKGIPRHPVKLLVICTNWQKVKEVYTNDDEINPGKLFRYIPRHLIKSTVKKGDVIGHVALSNGSSITFASVESFKKNPQSMESSDWDAIHVDEPCPETMYKAAARGLVDRGGKTWFTLTPLDEPWISSLFFPDPEDHSLVEVVEEGAKKRWAASWSMFDNTHLSQAAIDQFISLLTPEEKECRLYGRPFNLVGCIYTEFRREKHVLSELPRGWTSWNQPPKAWSHYVFIDPHPKTPHAVQFYAVPPAVDRVYLYHEIFEQMPPSRLASKILAILGDAHLIEAYMDPLGFIEDPETGMSMADRFAEVGLPLLKATKDLHSGIMVAKEKLARDRYFRMSPHCHETIKEFREYRWAIDRKTGLPLNKPVDEDDHMMENFYRAMLADLYYVDTTNSIPIPQETFESRRYDLPEFSYSE